MAVSKPIADLSRDSWSLYLRHATVFIGYSAWLLVPMALSVLLSLISPSDAMDIVQFINGTLGLIVGTWLTIVIIKITTLLQNKKRVRPRTLSRQAWKLFIPYLLLSIIINVMTAIGIILLIVPGLIVIVRLSYAQILVVQEKLDPMAAIKESIKRTKKHTWMLLKRLLGGVLIIGLPYALFIGFIAVGFANIHGLDILTFFMETQPTLLEIICFQLLDILFLPAFLIYWTLMFQDLDS